MCIKKIPNQDLRLDDIPEDVSDWEAFLKFALTINGYEVVGSFEECVEIGKAKKDDTLTNLRICLFYEARKDYWTRGFGPDGYGPDEESARDVNEMLEKVREKVEANDLQ